MDEFEDNLRRTLHKPEPSPDLAERVIAYVGEPRRRRGFPMTRYAAVAAVLISLSVGGLHYYQLRAERLQGERAKQQIIQAFRLAAERMKPFQDRLDKLQRQTISIPREN